jgi:UDP-glucuronate decarboxylase
MNKRVFVAGGAGFIGHHLCNSLLKRGHEVLCFDNLSSGRLVNINELKKNKRFRFLRGDITRSIRLNGSINEIYNLASLASPVDYEKFPIETLRANTYGIFNLVKFALSKNAKLLQTSTSEIYGDPLEHPQKETYLGNVNNLGWRGCYDEGKRVAETILVTFHNTKSLKIQIARIFNTYGPGMRTDDGRVIPEFIKAAIKNKRLPVNGGKQTRSFCYVDDLVRGLIKLQSLPKYVGPMNLGNPEEITIANLARQIIYLLGSKSGIKFLPNQPDDPRKRKPDIKKAYRTMDWVPRIEFQVGLKKTIAELSSRLK